MSRRTSKDGDAAVPIESTVGHQQQCHGSSPVARSIFTRTYGHRARWRLSHWVEPCTLSFLASSAHGRLPVDAPIRDVVMGIRDARPCRVYQAGAG